MSARPLTLVSEQEYLAGHYEPDCEFEDGALIERNVGTEKHSWLQAALAAYFFRKRRAWNLNVYTEQRIRIRAGKYKLPDVCIVLGARPATPIFDQPPFLAIEILSPEDKPLRVERTITEWLEFGVAYVWVIDPETLESALHSSQARIELKDGKLRIPDSLIEVPLRELEED